MLVFCLQCHQANPLTTPIHRSSCSTHGLIVVIIIIVVSHDLLLDADLTQAVAIFKARDAAIAPRSCAAAELVTLSPRWPSFRPALFWPRWLPDALPSELPPPGRAAAA